MTLYATYRLSDSAQNC